MVTDGWSSQLGVIFQAAVMVGIKHQRSRYRITFPKGFLGRASFLPCRRRPVRKDITSYQEQRGGVRIEGNRSSLPNPERSQVRRDGGHACIL